MVAAIAVVAMGTAGCGLTVEKLPLPKPGVDGETQELHAVFDNALNLPQDAKVKVGGADVGVVEKITTTNFKADVTMKIQNSVQLPKDGTRAELRQATPLGDVFVSIEFQPLKPGGELLGNGATIDNTSAGATVEELLISASTLINGGVLTQAANIMNEAASMVGGKGPQLTHLIEKLTSVVGTLNERTAAIDGTLKQTDTLLATLNQRRGDLGQIANSLPSMISVLAQNNQTIGDLLAKTATASDALKDFADTSGGQLDSLLVSVDSLMSSIAVWQNKIGGLADGLGALTPKIVASTKSTSITATLILDQLTLGSIWDQSGSRWPELGDVNSLVVSLTDVLQHLYARITGNY
ncbi:MCE family protein [Nocardiaceae bacterium YC2-7]|uniref:MCE family protein n=1 Tax=Antrihabitans stalactiti TaxID=2584121 RepID=A0A848KE12_9NOCA|nr:MCE family protein [Antrihabitans stalactiti]NMN95384.1 MCE family protein [Antrihabitans stalactiti]